MSTKNLARTVIEGGRDNWSKHKRRYSHRDARARVRLQLVAATIDPECSEDMAFERRRAVCRSFEDKLSPADRWMRKQVGRPWTKVEGELLKLFDTRTIAGRHVVYDHMMRRPGWDPDGIWRVGRTHFFVDAKGFLRTTVPRWRLNRAPRIHVSPCELERVRTWAAGRKVLAREGVLYWAEATSAPAPGEEPRYRQGRRLDETAERLFSTFSVGARDSVIWRAAT